MPTRILNADSLASHGNIAGRRAVLDILEAGLQAADPYHNIIKLVRIESGRLIVGHADFEPKNPRRSGDEVFDLDEIERIYVFGAGKGCQRVAEALEDVLGDSLTGGHIIAKHGDDVHLNRIGFTHGAHPVPDKGCVRGCQRILEMCRGLTHKDLVFTIAANGVSSLLTLPVPGVSLDDVRRITYLMQIERGAPTGDLNPVRNHLDQMKGGRLSVHIQPAQAIHLVVFEPGTCDALLHCNVWLPNLPEASTFADAVACLKKWDAWDEAPPAIKWHLERADPRYETVKANRFSCMSPYRIFGIMPEHLGMMPTAQKKAAALGFEPHRLTHDLRAEASQAGVVLSSIALNVEKTGQPFEPPCALFSAGELVVTVGAEKGVGGRNQEFALAAALTIAGSENIVVGAVDSDGSDGPSTQFIEGGESCPTLAGGIVDGMTAARAESRGVDIHRALGLHDATPALCRIGEGVIATPNISMNDLDVILVSSRS